LVSNTRRVPGVRVGQAAADDESNELREKMDGAKARP
jgi:hypothetical protein